MQEFLISLSHDHMLWVYIVIVVVAIVEGPILSILLGVLIKLGYFPFATTYIVLMLGDIFGDCMWYALGHFYGYKFVNRFGKYFSITPERIKMVENFFHVYKRSILIISKLTTGFGFAVPLLFTAGLVKIPFRIYFTLNLIGQFVWTALLVGLGYFFSELFISFDNILARMSTVALFVMVIVLFLGFTNYVKKRISGSI